MTPGGDPDALLDACADLIEWSQVVGLPADYPSLWRRHDALRRRAHRAPSLAVMVEQILRGEIDAWVETIRSCLQPELALDLIETLAPNGSGVWMRLDPDRGSEPDMYDQRDRSCRVALAETARRFQSSPRAARIAEMLRCVDGVVEARSNGGLVDPDALEEELRRLAVAIRKRLPPVAREVLGRLAELRADDCAGSSSAVVDERGERRVPSWEQLQVGGGTPEPAGVWFLPEVQSAYEEVRLAREFDHAHGEAVAEDARRAQERLEEERRGQEEERLRKEEHERRQEEERLRQKEDRLRQEDDERRVARERAKLEKAQEAERARERDREYLRAMDSVYEQAVSNLNAQLALKHLTLKRIVESQRNRMIREEQERLLGWI